MIELFLGGQRSGKSRLAERRARDTGLPVVYVATAEAHDAEMAARIARHRADRPADWTTVEAPLDLAAALAAYAAPGRCLLVDCLTLWLTNLLCAEDTSRFHGERDALLAALPTLPGHVILVSNEVGQGIVPLGELTRRFVDEAGWLNQDVAEVCERVTFVAAGLPLPLKGA